jgi:hypothetical protein
MADFAPASIIDGEISVKNLREETPEFGIDGRNILRAAG